MPIFFLFVAVIMIVAGINGKTTELSELVKGDFKGNEKTPGFFAWVIAIFCIGALGYIKDLKPLANAFLVLLVLVIILVNGQGKNGGFFQKFTEATGIAK